MKILYITPTIYDEGGVSRVLSIKSKFLIEKYHHQLYFLTTNNAETNFFYEFHQDIVSIDIKKQGVKILKTLHYYSQVKKQIAIIQPDVIVLCDFGWKGFCFNYFIKTTIPVIFEVHGSIDNETKPFRYLYLNKLRSKVRKYLLTTFKNVVFLSDDSKKEWDNEGIVIPNPLSFDNYSLSKLESKKVITVARHSYEKGIDRLLPIWQKVNRFYPDWQLEIFGDGFSFQKNKELSTKLGIDTSVNFNAPVKDIQSKYLDSSIYLMTSRQEGLPMSLIEAMCFGLPIVAYDCPVGPRSIIENCKNGFLITEDDEETFVKKVIQLIESKELRRKTGTTAQESVKKYIPSEIMKKWNDFFLFLVSK